MMKYILPLFVPLLIVLAAGAGYVYMLNTIQSAINEVAVARDDITAAEQREAFARTAGVFLAETADEREELNSFITQDADFVSVIETVEASAKREGVATSVASVTVRDGGFQFYERVLMTLSVEGAFADVASFVASLEMFPVASRVTQVSLETSADASWFGTIMLEFVKRKSTTL